MTLTFLLLFTFQPGKNQMFLHLDPSKQETLSQFKGTFKLAKALEEDLEQG